MRILGYLLLAGVMALGIVGCNKSELKLLNVSYDPTRELWEDLNQKFITQFEKDTGKSLAIEQSHGGSGSQARTVIDGLDADVVTLALWSDTDALRKKGLIKDKWEDRLPNRSLPYYSTIVFVVRKGNPKQVKDWPDLVREDVKIVTPNPKTSGNGKLSLLAAWASVVTRGGTEEQAKEFINKLYRNVDVLDSGARGSNITFVQKQLGDVHLTWENEAYLEVHEAKGDVEIVYPPISIKAEPHVALVDASVDRKGTRAAAEAYLKYLYTDEAQETMAKHYYRPSNDAIRAKHTDKFLDIKLVPITGITAGWDDANAKFFGEGALFDQIYSSKRK